MTNETPTIHFDEVDANRLLVAVQRQLSSVAWNVMDPDDWSQLQALKTLEQRILAWLDGENP